MTLDVLSFIDSKGGNAEEIRESQKKRGLSVELVDEVIQMYADWVKSKWPLYMCATQVLTFRDVSQWTSKSIKSAKKSTPYRKASQQRRRYDQIECLQDDVDSNRW